MAPDARMDCTPAETSSTSTQSRGGEAQRLGRPPGPAWSGRCPSRPPRRPAGCQGRFFSGSVRRFCCRRSGPTGIAVCAVPSGPAPSPPVRPPVSESGGDTGGVVFLHRKPLVFLWCVGETAVFQHDLQTLHPGHASAPVSLAGVKEGAQPVRQGLPGPEMELVGESSTPSRSDKIPLITPYTSSMTGVLKLRGTHPHHFLKKWRRSM